MKNYALAREHVYWLLGSMLLVYGTQFQHLPPWISVTVVLATLWRAGVASGHLSLPRAWLFIPLAAAGVAGVIATHGGMFGRNASVSLLSVMMAFKLLESRSRRDAMLLVYLSFFLIVTSFLFTQSLLLGVYMTLPLTTLTATMLTVSHPNGRMSVQTRLRMAGQMLVQSLPLMLILFLLFPRIEGPLWGVPEDTYSGMTGLSDQMSPGSISQLSRSDSVAFRAVFQGRIPPASERYWRGPVFWQFDGLTWRAEKKASKLPKPDLTHSGNAVQYTITLEPHNRPWLFMLDMPASRLPGSTMTPDMQLLSPEPVRTRKRYEGLSWTQYRLGTILDEETRALSLQLPADGNHRSRDMARQWAASARSGEAVVLQALRHFREQPFRYTLNPPRLGNDVIDGFLFETRSGFCEHYAGSFVFLMRAAGIPARVVTGYQGGEPNPNSDYLLIRQTDAHAWAEVWLDGRGWVRVDPTAAVAPQRVESGMANAVPAGEPVPVLLRPNMHWLHLLNLRWDAVNNAWNQWVLGYDEHRQIALLSRLAGSRLSAGDMVLLMMGLLGSALTLTLTFMLLKRQREEPLQAAYRKLQRKLARAGLDIRRQEGPIDFGTRAAHAFPEHAGRIHALTVEYARLCYGKFADTHAIEAFRQQVREFRI